jgi:NAD(P)-dependent dehydrogenase (short-subunit alcohol dehydrogenase family)
MPDFPYRTALIVGAGAGISAALARRLSARGVNVGLAARNVGKLGPLVVETGATAFEADASDPASVAALFEQATNRIGEPDVVVYNAGLRAQGPLADLDPALVERVLQVGAFGGFLVAQQAARLMVPRGRGAILFTGASASVKGYPLSAPFAMGKFALRGLAQSAARELGPKGIHVAHFVIDGGVRSSQRPVPAENPDSLLDPEAIAQTYLDVLRQPRSAWSLEVELRPWVERF